jgi:hypothetical protein
MNSYNELANNHNERCPRHLVPVIDEYIGPVGW